MSRSLYAVMPVLAALLLSGCEAPTTSKPAPGRPVLVEEQPPEPTCPPADNAPIGPPEPIEDGSYRDGADYDC